MRRDLQALSNQAFDLLVIGGGIQGACVAWEATLRGLSVALVEQGDFASGTSANSLKVIHGGLRYLQSADFKRMRQSIRERQTLMRIAPHLVHPMPVLVPTYGHGLKGKEAMTAALKVNDAISGDRNFALKDRQKHIPAGQILSKQACLEKLPDLTTEGLTGAALFHDAQVYNSERLVLAFVRSAAQKGACVANYLQVVDFIREAGSRVSGAIAQDRLSNNRVEIRARAIVNASGPWIGSLMSQVSDEKIEPKPLAKAMNLVTRPLLDAKTDDGQRCAVGITGRAPGSRLFFIAPWRDRALVGTWYSHNIGSTKPPTATAHEIEAALADINQAYSGFKLTPEDVEWVHAGLLPGQGKSKRGEVALTKQFELKDHRKEGFTGLLSVTGVKYTTARDLARRAVNWVFREAGQMVAPSTSRKKRLVGGEIEQFDPFLATAMHMHRGQVSTQSLRRLLYNYGSEYSAVLQQLTAAGEASDGEILAAETRYGVETEMAQTLSDIVFRRTELGSAGNPGQAKLRVCADAMGEVLGWSEEKRRSEIETVQTHFGSPGSADANVQALAQEVGKATIQNTTREAMASV